MKDPVKKHIPKKIPAKDLEEVEILSSTPKEARKNNNIKTKTTLMEEFKQTMNKHSRNILKKLSKSDQDKPLFQCQLCTHMDKERHMVVNHFLTSHSDNEISVQIRIQMEAVKKHQVETQKKQLNEKAQDNQPGNLQNKQEETSLKTPMVNSSEKVIEKQNE